MPKYKHALLKDLPVGAAFWFPSGANRYVVKSKHPDYITIVMQGRNDKKPSRPYYVPPMSAVAREL